MRHLIADNQIFHIWHCPNVDCENYTQHNTEVTPDFYEENGTPMCECGEDMAYLRTEVELGKGTI